MLSISDSCSEHRIAESLSRVATIQHQRQHSTRQLMNSIPYRVTAHGKKNCI